ncbi:MAG: hypothetical protein ACRDH5_06715, partial [bacterium]
GGGTLPSPRGDDLPWPLIGGLGVLAAAGAFGARWFLAGRRRPSGTVPQAVAEEAPVDLLSSDTRRVASARRPIASWELASALDDEPIGTVDFVGDEGPTRARSGSLRESAETHAWGDDVDRRTLFRRIGLPDKEEL